MVTGHAGNRGNEIADGLARGGTALRFLGTQRALGVFMRDLKKSVAVWSTSMRTNGDFLLRPVKTC